VKLDILLNPSEMQSSQDFSPMSNPTQSSGSGSCEQAIRSNQVSNPVQVTQSLPVTTARKQTLTTLHRTLQLERNREKQTRNQRTFTRNRLLHSVRHMRAWRRVHRGFLPLQLRPSISCIKRSHVPLTPRPPPTLTAQKPAAHRQLQPSSSYNQNQSVVHSSTHPRTYSRKHPHKLRLRPLLHHFRAAHFALSRKAPANLMINELANS
jgi:hypothetical protein